jgi:hypothetical protein
LCVALLALLSLALPAAAQTSAPPEFLIRSLFCGIENGQVVVRFDVVNAGGPATEPAEVVTSSAGSGPLATDQVPPLASDARQPVELRFPSNLASGTLRLRTTVTASDADSGGGPAIVQTASCAVNIPVTEPAADPVLVPTSAPAAGGWSFGFDVRPEWLLGIVLALCCGVLALAGLIWLASRLFRRTPPVFPMWQPPYVSPALLNPATPAGARAGWQEAAASDALPTPCLPYDHAARKVLMGMDGVKLRNWRFEALRAVQYDMYGRVGRTQVIASKRLIQRLNQQLEKSQPRTGKPPRALDAIIRALLPSAASLANRLQQTTGKTPSLPIALDLRLTGDHGSVRILFELYTCADGGWRLVDAWEPELMLRSGQIVELFSYTFYGRLPAESKKEFRRRLRADMAQRLAMMIAQPPPPPPVRSAPLEAAEPPVPAGSTAPAAPVQFDQPAPPPTQEIPRVPDAPDATKPDESPFAPPAG